MARRDEIVSKVARTGIPDTGLKRVVNESAWGEQTATQRYGGGTRTFPEPADRHAPQRLGDKNNLQDTNYHNDTPNNWLRGAGSQGAEGKPNFDHRGNPDRGGKMPKLP